MTTHQFRPVNPKYLIKIRFSEEDLSEKAWRFYDNAVMPDTAFYVDVRTGKYYLFEEGYGYTPLRDMDAASAWLERMADLFPDLFDEDDTDE